MKTVYIRWLFIVIAIANVIGNIIAATPVTQYTKPLLMPLLMLYLYQSSVGQVSKKTLLLFIALFFSWLGDLSLMYQTDRIYFMLGIGFFLLAQITYIVVLRQSTHISIALSGFEIVPFLIYAGLLMYVLLPAGDFTIPIVLYGSVILAMSISAFSRKGSTTVSSFRLAFVGSLFFLLSDSILAINAFRQTIPYAGALIMSTYCTAQFLLTEGLIKHPD